MHEDGIRGDAAKMCSTATRTCAYARVAGASGTTRSSVGLDRRGRAVLGHRVKRPGDLTLVRVTSREHWASLTGSRITDVVRRLRVAVVAPETFVKPSGLRLRILIPTTMF